MQMDIHAQPFKLTAAIEQHVAGRVAHALGTSSPLVHGVMVRLSGVNGERSGANMACRIVVWLRRGGTIVVEAVDRDLYDSISAASVKLHTAMTQRLNRRRTLRRQHPTRRFVFPFDDRRSPMLSHTA